MGGVNALVPLSPQEKKKKNHINEPGAQKPPCRLLRECDVEGMRALILQSGLISRGLAKPSISRGLDDAKLMCCTLTTLEHSCC